jgi:FMN reductase
MASVLVLSGSPSKVSRTAALADFIVRRLVADGLAARHVALRTLPPADLVAAHAGAPGIAEVVAELAAADGLVIVTPTYKAAYSGLTKIFLDLLPQSALEDKAVLPIATGGSLAHVLALDYSFRAVLHSMRARHVVQSHFVPDSCFLKTDGGYEPDETALGPLFYAAFDEFRRSVHAHEHFRSVDFVRSLVPSATKV